MPRFPACTMLVPAGGHEDTTLVAAEAWERRSDPWVCEPAFAFEADPWLAVVAWAYPWEAIATPGAALEGYRPEGANSGT